MARRQVRWSVDAEQDLEDIVAYIAQDNPANALVVFDRLYARARTLETLAGRGRRVPEIASSVEPPLRELIEEPWRIMYAVRGDKVMVVAVVDSRRDVGIWLAQRFGVSLDPP